MSIYGTGELNMTKAQAKARRKLTSEWQTARKLGVNVPTMRALVREGYAERQQRPSSFTNSVNFKYRLSTTPRWSERRILQILTGKWPQWTWECRQENFIFALKVIRKVGIDTVSFGHNVQRDSLADGRDVVKAGRAAIVELKDALKRYRKGK